MARLFVTANGNLTAAATWGLVDATSALDSIAANVLLTAAYQESSAFTPGAITIDGIAVRVATRPGAVGTITVRLAQAGADVASTPVTLNVTDLHASANGWYLFKFAAPVLLVAATAYTVSAKTSSTNQVNLFTNGTATNWTRLLRTTTTQAPAAGDDMYIGGEWTAAATVTTRTVTMDSTATTDYGSASTTLSALSVSKEGVLTWGTTAATAYRLRLSGLLTIFAGGIVNMGTTGTPCPRDSTQELQFDCAANGDFGLVVAAGGTWNAQGQSRTAGKLIDRCRLSADAAAAATTLNVDFDTGWLGADDIALASTSRTATQHEQRVLNANAGAASMVITVGLTTLKMGTTPALGEVVLLTRNVRVVAVSASFKTYVDFQNGATADVDWVQFKDCGSGAAAGKFGITIQTTAAGVNLNFCCSWNSGQNGINARTASHNAWVVTNYICYNSTSVGIDIIATTGTTWSLDGAIVIGAGSNGFAVADWGGTISNCTAASSQGAGFAFADNNLAGTLFGNTAHSNLTNGFNFQQAVTVADFSSFTAWRNNSAGFTFDKLYKCRFLTGVAFGNNASNVQFNSSVVQCVFRSFTVNGDTTFATTNGFNFNTSADALFPDLRFDNCSMGAVSGILAAHTNDFNFGGLAIWVKLFLRNMLLASATEFANFASLKAGSEIHEQRRDQTNALHRTQYTHGIVSYDTTTFRSAAPSEKLTPSAATLVNKLEGGVRRVAITTGLVLTVSVYARKDGTYNGNAPRLILKANPAVGVNSDTVLATHSAAVNTWQQLTGAAPAAIDDGVLEFLVDCDGTAGNAFDDDWAASMA